MDATKKRTPTRIRGVVVALIILIGAIARPADSRLSGDANGDGALNIGDPLYVLSYLFAGGVAPGECLECENEDGGLPDPWTVYRRRAFNAADVNADWKVNVADPIHLLRHLFAGGPPPERCGTCWPCGGRRLPATGIKDCCWGYGKDSPVACDDPEWIGQDAQLQLGCPQEGRYVDNGDGTVSDLCTGLMWQKETAVPLPDSERAPAVQWDDALAYAEGLEFAGWDDWRLPNIFELFSLMRLHCEVQPTFEAYFPEVFPPVPMVPVSIWCLYFTSTANATTVGGNISNPMFDDYWGLVRCVRGGLEECDAVLPATGVDFCVDPRNTLRKIPCDSPEAIGQDGYYRAGCPFEGRFVDNGDGTVTDLCTGLMWQKQIPLAAEYGGDAYGRVPWQGALQYARDLDLGGRTDWRVPNYFELVYSIDWWWNEKSAGDNRAGTAIYPIENGPWGIHDGIGVNATHWTSSATRDGWHMVFLRNHAYNGSNVPGNMGSACPDCIAFVRCVRGPIWIDER